MLDAICLKQYGRWSLDVLLPLCRANPWVLSLPLRLPAGRILVLPALALLTETLLTVPMWRDEAVKARKAKTLFTFSPDKEYAGQTVLEYLKQYRRQKLQTTDERIHLEQDSQPTHGTILNTNNEVYRYSPQVGFVGTDRFRIRAADGNTTVDTGIIEIVVPASGSIARYEIFAADALVAKLAKLIFCAVRKTRITSVQVFIAHAEEELLESHQILSGQNLATVDVTLQKRLSSGGVVPFADVARLNNVKRTGALTVAAPELNPGECMVAQVPRVSGNVWGLWVDVYSSVLE